MVSGGPRYLSYPTSRVSNTYKYTLKSMVCRRLYKYTYTHIDKHYAHTHAQIHSYFHATAAT